MTLTTQQKSIIITLRHAGKGYASIAHTLGLKKNTVAAFCQKHNLGWFIGNGEAVPSQPQGFACKGTRAYRVTYKFVDSANDAAVTSALAILGRSDNE